MKFFKKWRAKQRLLSELWSDYHREELAVAHYVNRLMEETDSVELSHCDIDMKAAAERAANAKARYEACKKMKLSNF